MSLSKKITFNQNVNCLDRISMMRRITFSYHWRKKKIGSLQFGYGVSQLVVRGCGGWGLRVRGYAVRGRWFAVRGFRYGVSGGSGFRVQGFGGWGFRVRGFVVRCFGLGLSRFRVLEVRGFWYGVRGSGTGFRDSGIGVGVFVVQGCGGLGFRVRVHGSWFWIGGFGYVVSGMRYGVLEVGDLGGTGFGYEVSVTGFRGFWRLVVLEVRLSRFGYVVSRFGVFKVRGFGYGVSLFVVTSTGFRCSRFRELRGFSGSGI